jgi:hypothetical protein
MSKLVPVFYSMMVGWGLLTLDYHNDTLRNPSSPVADYLFGLSSRIGAPLGMVGGRVDLAQLLPPAPPGWTRHAYTPADGQVITGIAYDPAAPVQDTAAAVLRDYAASTAPDHQIAVTYEKAGRLVVLRLAYDPDQMVTRIEHTASTGSDAPDLPPGARPYGKIRGMAFARAPVTRRNPETGAELDVDFRLLMASMGQQASLTVLTNAGDTSLRRILGAADTQALGQFLQDPKATAAALAEINRQQIMAAANGL